MKLSFIGLIPDIKMRGIDTKDIDVIILCGGSGTRLQSVVKDRPKPMAEINEKPFLDILVEHVGTFGFKRFVLCAGYKAEAIQEYYKNKKTKQEIIVSKEKKPLGTGGAIKNAENLIKTNPFLVMNGDSFCPINLHKFVDFHMNKKALISMVLVDADANVDYGTITLGNSQEIVKFEEKIRSGKNGLMNAGIYLFDASVLAMLPPNREFSLEYELFPERVNKKIYGYVTEGPFIDIGTPENFRKAKQVLKDLQYLTSGDL